ncbi:hypothetical protein NCCP2716_23630 [Sporosarcina sp. NCCP-2716]|uniref:Panacea domain-containing protein n=1 Tax=Sporosarcina sp. NCCP-2716 TaxID=2943679 RepID=UPI00203D5634|nr:Panacea domain-containing protein [Sporosarcina sp. NCCP-2716]GKV69865.1 hypothetical protein NCCP2716_23630 [Sporosarcina sp. NCCP-2716]
MVRVKYILRYFASYYPYKSELSKARITKMVYLADWYSAKKYGKQLTKINWYFDHYGPFVSDVYEEALKDKELIVKKELTAFGSPKETIYLKTNSVDDLKLNRISEKEVKILNEVIEDTKMFNWSEFIDYVYNTEPIKNYKRYNYLDLERIASKLEH